MAEREGFIPKEWVAVADVDLSRSYEVDQHVIWYTGTGFVYSWASGCSCWNGEYFIHDEFPTLNSLHAYLRSDIDYGPSQQTVDDLISQATEWENARTA